MTKEDRRDGVLQQHQSVGIRQKVHHLPSVYTNEESRIRQKEINLAANQALGSPGAVRENRKNRAERRESSSKQ